MTDAARLHESRAAVRVLTDMLRDRADRIAERHPESSAAHLRALYVSDDQWVALTTAIDALEREAAEVESYIDARRDQGFRSYVIGSRA